jgi:hypothetical protein
MLTRAEIFIVSYLCSTSFCFGISLSNDVTTNDSSGIETVQRYSYSEIKATATTSLKRKGNQLKSTQTVSWNGTPSGLVFFEWIPPVNSKCEKTSFPIKKYDVDYNRTHTDRSILGVDQKPCRGLWKAEVVTKSNKVLSSSSLLVS